MKRFALILVTSCGRIAFDPITPLDGPFALTCSTFEFAFAVAPPSTLSEPAIHPDGLRLVADNNSGLLEGTRPTPSSLFENPVPSTAIATLLADPAFATIGGMVVAFGASLDATRHLHICRDPMSAGTCEDITVIDDATSTVIVDDHDGPSIATRDGELLMTFNRGDLVYLARVETADLLTWRATRVDPGIPVDDPAITPDGQILIVEERFVGVHALRWDDQQATFVDRVFIGPGASPAIGIQQGSSFELFVTNSLRGVTEPLVATCTTSP